MTTNIETPILHSFAPIADDADLGQLAMRMSGYRWKESGIVQIWRATGRENPDVFFAETLGLKDKAAYLAHRDLLKAHLVRFGLDQRALAKSYSQPGGDALAQSAHARRAHFITSLIEIRRAGKLWSAAQAAVAKVEEELIAAE